MAAINKLFLQKGVFGRIIVGWKIELLRWQLYKGEVLSQKSPASLFLPAIICFLSQLFVFNLKKNVS